MFGPTSRLVFLVAAVFLCWVWTATTVRSEESAAGTHHARLPQFPSDPARIQEDHAPLRHALQWARQVYGQIDRSVHDYSCILVRRERVDGRLSNFEYIYAKVRYGEPESGDSPFSVFLRFLGPSDVEGREVLYVEGENDDKVIVRKGGRRFSYLTLAVDPYSDLAIRDNRYPITEFGIQTLVRRLIEVAEEQLDEGDCLVRFYRDASVDGRPCVMIEVEKTRNSESARFFRARVYIDEQLQVPIHFETYDWPAEEGGPPLLLEQYTYRNLRLNIGLTDEDFDRNNPNYQLSSSNSR